jgi:hypothetical protein
MDESGIHDGAHVCVIAGYWGTVKKWKKFENRWKTILRDANEPTLVEFHSTEFWHKDDSRKGVFAKWSNQKADRFIDDLARFRGFSWTTLLDCAFYTPPIGE